MHSEAFRRFVLSQHCGHGCQSKPLGGLKGCGPVHLCIHPGQTNPSEAFRRFVLSHHCGHGCQLNPFGGLKGCGAVHPCCHRGLTKPSEAFRRFVLSQHCGHGFKIWPFKHDSGPGVGAMGLLMGSALLPSIQDLPRQTSHWGSLG